MVSHKGGLKCAGLMKVLKVACSFMKVVLKEGWSHEGLKSGLFFHEGGLKSGLVSMKVILKVACSVMKVIKVACSITKVLKVACSLMKVVPRL